MNKRREPPVEEGASVNELIERLGANCIKVVKPSGTSAKSEIRRLLGTYQDGELLDYTILEIAAITKKSEINIRTILSDLRSPKYCGKDGVFLTERIRRPDGSYSFRYVPQAGYEHAEKRDLDVPGIKDVVGPAPGIPVGAAPPCNKPFKIFRMIYTEEAQRTPLDSAPLNEIDAMIEALQYGTSDKRYFGVALRNTCRRLGVVYSEKALKNYLTGR